MARILVSMPDEFLKSIDKIAGTEQRTRSELVREALRAYIRKTNPINAQRAQANAGVLEDLLK